MMRPLRKPVAPVATVTKTKYHVIRGRRVTPLRVLAMKIRLAWQRLRYKPWHVVLKEEK